MSQDGTDTAVKLAMSATCVLHALLRDMQRNDPELADRLLGELDNAHNPNDEIVQDARSMVERLKHAQGS